MSFKNSFLFVVIASVLLFASCEDKKKVSEANKETVKEQLKDSVIPTEASEENIETKKNTYPEITQKNVVEFLTQYGKDNPETKVLLSTRFGDMTFQLFEDTPLHRANFIYLVKQEYFNETFFHRVVPNFIIQGGNSDLRSTPKKRAAIGKDYLLPAELQSGRKHRYGTISGAKEYRENPDKQTAPFEFFIFIGPETQTSTGHLNGNYTIFGQVIQGMDVLEKIASVKRDEGDWPLENIYLKAKVLE
ncbi:peptidylprolyl isomerase [Ulvibacter litoralis]|uniref:Peptidyl-prolyl cis-trans isomerase n=1 Tax=Ulvibacter litoralis TaxID=227084 RepID=A0A1G7EZ36_9FLAO|nr:peptidylprolyl isomerase [Ulvibacter litoralis]GHC53345.1 peptidyl-prolyl cis-trans isomerase [Ulvibacter litoralis]SDE68980.1 peptidylprolyl isomerase [Ulvibacter litoralis]